MNLLNSDQKTPLYIACEKNNLDLVGLLLSYKASNKITCTDKGESVIHLAALKGYAKLLNLLIENDCEVNLLDGSNENALHIAVRNENMEIISILLDAGVDFNLKNKNGQTPFDLASKIELKNRIYDKISKIRKNDSLRIKALESDVELLRAKIEFMEKDFKNEFELLHSLIQCMFSDVNSNSRPRNDVKSENK